MTTHDRLTLEEVLAAFDEHLRRTRDVCPGTRLNYARYAGAFLQTVFAGRPVVPAEIRVHHVAGFVSGLTGRYRPRTVELAASALRSFFRFLRAEGLREDRLEDAVPMVPHRPAALIRHLDRGTFEQLIASLDTTSPRGLRDRAIILCMARLGLRASEVVQLRLEDLDWRNAVVRVRPARCTRPPCRRCVPTPPAGSAASARPPAATRSSAPTAATGSATTPLTRPSAPVYRPRPRRRLLKGP